MYENSNKATSLLAGVWHLNVCAVVAHGSFYFHVPKA